MTEQQPVSQQQSASAPAGVNQALKAVRKVVIRTHSQVIFYYPTMLLAFFYGASSDNAPDASNAGLFLSVLAFNTFVIHFDFSSYRAALLVATLGAIGVLLWHFEILGGIFVFLENIDFRINNHAFTAIGAIFLFMILCDLLWAQLNRWEFSANEVKHVRFLQGSVSFPGRGLALRRKIKDLFEYVLGFGAGDVILRVGKKSVRLDNVLVAQRKVQKIESFIRSAGVYNDDIDVFDGDDGDDDF